MSKTLCLSWAIASFALLYNGSALFWIQNSSCDVIRLPTNSNFSTMARIEMVPYERENGYVMTTKDKFTMRKERTLVYQ